MSMKKIAPSGAAGNTRLLSKFGGGSSGPRQEYRPGYATGGVVKAKGGEVSGGSRDADGAPAKPPLARAGRKMGKGKPKGDAKTNINIIIAGKGDAPASKPPMPPMGGPGGPPPDMGPPPGAPPMPPMRAKGGRVNSDAAEDKAMVTKMIHKHEKEDHKGSPMTKFASGGKIRQIKDGAGGGKGRLEKIAAYGKK